MKVSPDKSRLHTRLCGLLSALFVFCPGLRAERTDVIGSHGIWWKLSAPAETGIFVTGDPWVVGAVEVVGIKNTISSEDYEPRKGQHGSMVNPLVGHDRMHQGYESGLSTYREHLNAALPNGEPVSPQNPLRLSVDSSLVSTVSWLYNSPTDMEPGTPGYSTSSKTPRSATRAVSILTVLSKPPPANAFRPAYCGEVKKIFTTDDIHWDRLKNLPAPANTPDLEGMAARLSRPWLDHAFEWIGAMIHPSMSMPNYGRDMGRIIVEATLAVNTNIPKDQKQRLTLNLIQLGIDLTGIADNGGGWRANGGHALGRKWPILFSGILLDDPHMKNVGNWDRTFDHGVEFQEDQNHFYITEADVEREKYDASLVGAPEWGIRHAYRPAQDNPSWKASYRDINGGITTGMALAVLIMNARELWNHEAFFDYQDRYFHHPESPRRGTNAMSDSMRTLWETHRSKYPPVWAP